MVDNLACSFFLEKKTLWIAIVFCPKRRRFIHCSLKKSPKRCRFERHYGSSSSPGGAKKGKKKIFLPPVFTDFLPLKSIKKTLTKDPPLAQSFPRVGGAAAQWPPGLSLPCFLPIKTGEERAKRKREQKREHKRAKERRKTERKKGKKIEQRREKGGGEKERKKQRREMKKKKHRAQPCPQPPLAASLRPPQSPEAP